MRFRLTPVRLTILALCALAAVLGWRLGSGRMALTETDAILAAAALWQAETGGQATDCAAVPDPSDTVWLTVHCRNGTEARWYSVDTAGRLRAMADPGI
jgi:hypothetical protein